LFFVWAIENPAYFVVASAYSSVILAGEDAAAFSPPSSLRAETLASKRSEDPGKTKPWIATSGCALLAMTMRGRLGDDEQRHPLRKSVMSRKIIVRHREERSDVAIQFFVFL
jgi:hypothetical protein